MITATADGRIPAEEYTYTETAPDRWTVTAWSAYESDNGEIIRRKCYTTSGLNEAQIRAQLANLEAWGYIIH